MLQNQESFEKTTAEIQYTALKTIFSFSRRPEWWSFQKKLRWNMIFLVLSRKINFSENIILPPDRKWKMIFLKKYKEIWYLLQMFRKDGIFKKNRAGTWSSLYYLERWYFFPKTWYFFRGRKMRQDLSQEIHGKMIFSVYMCRCYKRDAMLPLPKKSNMILSRKNTPKGDWHSRSTP